MMLSHGSVQWLVVVCLIVCARASQGAPADSSHASAPPLQKDSSILPPPSSWPFDTTVHRDSLVPAGPDLARIAITGGGLVGGITALHIYQLNAWWKADRTAFHVIEDADYQSEFDKVGHIFASYQSSFFFDEAYRWCGLDSAQSSLLGALSGALWEFYIEIEDGFASEWGFSRGDAKSDIAGAAFYLLNQRVPFLRDFRIKWCYTPTTKLTENRPDIPGQSVTFIEDYGGQTYYLRGDIHAMLPESMKSYWPSWLNLAVAVSGYDINVIGFENRHKAWYVSLDYDMDKIIPESSIGILNFLRRSLGFLHLPAPAFRFYPSPKFFLTFPISISFDHGLHVGVEPSLGGK
jgi:hypothetical protein